MDPQTESERAVGKYLLEKYPGKSPYWIMQQMQRDYLGDESAPIAVKINLPKREVYSKGNATGAYYPQQTMLGLPIGHPVVKTVAPTHYFEPGMYPPDMVTGSSNDPMMQDYMGMAAHEILGHGYEGQKYGGKYGEALKQLVIDTATGDRPYSAHFIGPYLGRGEPPQDQNLYSLLKSMKEIDATR